MCKTYSVPEVKTGFGLPSKFDLQNLPAEFQSDNSKQTGGAKAVDSSSPLPWDDEEFLELFEPLPEDHDRLGGVPTSTEALSNFIDQTFEMESQQAPVQLPCVAAHKMSVPIMSIMSHDDHTDPEIFSGDENSLSPDVISRLKSFDMIEDMDFGMSVPTFQPPIFKSQLPSAQAFVHMEYKTPEMIREEKLHVMDAFVGAMIEGDLFSIFSACQSQCHPNIRFESRSCGFNYFGSMAVNAFWMLLFIEHYAGKIDLLSSRVNSVMMPKRHALSNVIPDSGAFESVEFVVKLEGVRLSEFQGFALFKRLMTTGLIHEHLSMPEMISEIETFYRHDQQDFMAMQKGYMAQKFNKVTYLFEMKCHFHALSHQITHWEVELLGFQNEFVGIDVFQT